MTNLIRHVELPEGVPNIAVDLSRDLAREWLVTNGLGGYASGTIVGVPTRRYHGLLIAALPAPRGRIMMLNHLTEQVRAADGKTSVFGGEERPGEGVSLSNVPRSFELEQGLPVWRYKVDGAIVEKRLHLVHGQNTVHVRYALLEGKGVRVKLRPAIHMRAHDAPVDEALHEDYVLTATRGRFELRGPEHMPRLRMRVLGERTAFTFDEATLPEALYRVEASRGYPSRGRLWSPGHFRGDLTPNAPLTLVASTEEWAVIDALDCEEALVAELRRRAALLRNADDRARTPEIADLVLAADTFVISPAGRLGDNARARAAGDEVRSVIAGYHWFTDWGRDTMISLEGLTLVTGRVLEAGYILRTFALHVKDGLIPNLFPEGKNEGLYHTADATLWFFHALDRYLKRSRDRATLKQLLPTMKDIVAHHVSGTRFGIHVDASDGLLAQGAEGYQLTWMDAKVDDWVVTPRRGKAVEINALWYNALRLLESWLRSEGEASEADDIAKRAEQAKRSFRERFWFERGGHLYDVVDGPNGDDPSCRPNQIFAVSLDHPVLDEERWAPVVEVVRRELLTPFGLRSLARGNHDYKPTYEGDLRSRDAAYHQGTVWSWLLGPFVDAHLRVHPEDIDGARAIVAGALSHLDDACIGNVSEVFDAEAPYAPRGCIAQAWGVAEWLRAWVKTAI